MQEFPDGTPTNFVEKITKSLFLYNSNVSIFDLNNIFITCKFENIKQRYKGLMYNEDSRLIWDKCNTPKPHTIRAGNRWTEGTDIHFKIWSGKPYKDKTFNFAPIVPCLGVQDIEFKWATTNKGRCVRVLIDGNDITTDVDKIDLLAANDGFDNRKDFFNWFNQDFKGQIIHWTELKY